MERRRAYWRMANGNKFNILSSLLLSLLWMLSEWMDIEPSIGRRVSICCGLQRSSCSDTHLNSDVWYVLSLIPIGTSSLLLNVSMCWIHHSCHTYKYIYLLFFSRYIYTYLYAYVYISFAYMLRRYRQTVQILLSSFSPCLFWLSVQLNYCVFVLSLVTHIYIYNNNKKINICIYYYNRHLWIHINSLCERVYATNL